MASKAKANLNGASVNQLAGVEQIGEKLAKRIVEEMPFNDWNQVAKVPMIGHRRLQNLKDVFELGDSDNDKSGNEESEGIAWSQNEEMSVLQCQYHLHLAFPPHPFHSSVIEKVLRVCFQTCVSCVIRTLRFHIGVLRSN